MAEKTLNRYGELALAIREGRELQPPDLLATFMAMPHAELARTAVRAVARIADLKAIAALHHEVVERHNRIAASNEEIIGLLPEYLAEVTAKKTAVARWARLDSAKDWAFDERRANPQGSRTAFLTKARLDTIKALARTAGEPLTGDDPSVKATVTGWFRHAKIK